MSTRKPATTALIEVTTRKQGCTRIKRGEKKKKKREKRRRKKLPAIGSSHSALRKGEKEKSKAFRVRINHAV